MATYHLAVDIGASGGRVMAGSVVDQKLHVQEIHRFSNEMKSKSGQLVWDLDALFKEIKVGIHTCRDKGIIPTSIGVDTWAVDFVLLDDQDQLLTPAIAYRDARTNGVMEEVTTHLLKEKIYSYTGIQFQPFNTIYQLAALKKIQPEVFDPARSFLMLPDYFHFLLSGRKVNEYTNASSTQLLNAFTKHWDPVLLESIGIQEQIFEELVAPGTKLGGLRKELVAEFGFDLEVIAPATHDTASAVAAVPSTKESIYLSSGTWSLLGVENDEPMCGEKSLEYNFTNEGGVNNRFRFLKNIMGMWMLQEVRRLYEEQYSYDDLVRASKAVENPAIIDVDQSRFLNPSNMIEEIQAACIEAGQTIPVRSGDLAACVFHSLVEGYQQAISQVEEMTGLKYEQVNVIGGGSQNEYVNQLLANASGKQVIAGPVEATAIGNLIVQMIAQGEIDSLIDARELIASSFELKHYTSQKGEIHHG